jgi:hypothetical protein
LVSEERTTIDKDIDNQRRQEFQNSLKNILSDYY